MIIFHLKFPIIQLLACCLVLRKQGGKYPLWRLIHLSALLLTEFDIPLAQDAGLENVINFFG